MGTSETFSFSPERVICLWQEGHMTLLCDMLLWLHIKVRAVYYKALTLASGPFSPPQASLPLDSHVLSLSPPPCRVPSRAARCSVSCCLCCSPTSFKGSPGHVHCFFLCSGIFQMLLDTFLFVIHNENIPLNGVAISVVSLLHLLK